MKKLLCAVTLLCAYASAQTVNPNQIRPGTQDGEVLTTIKANQPPAWQQFSILCPVCVVKNPTGDQIITQLGDATNHISTHFTLADSVGDSCDYRSRGSDYYAQFLCQMSDGNGFTPNTGSWLSVNELYSLYDATITSPSDGVGEINMTPGDVELTANAIGSSGSEVLVRNRDVHIEVAGPNSNINLESYGPQASIGSIQLFGNMQLNYAQVCSTASATILWDAYTVHCVDATSGNQTITLPAAWGPPAAVGYGSNILIFVKKDATANTSTFVAGAGDTIAGGNVTLGSLGQIVTFVSDDLHTWYVQRGTVSNFSAPSASWPSWLVPTVANPTSTPSLAVAASPIPNSALQNSATTVNGQSCALGGTCTVTDSTKLPLAGGTLTGPTTLGRMIVPVYAGGSIATALAQCPADTSQTCELLLAPGHVTGNVTISRPNVWIVGAGMPNYYSTTVSTGDKLLAAGDSGGAGTVINCGVLFTYSSAPLYNERVEDLGVDQGDALVTAGTCPEQDALVLQSDYSVTLNPPVTNTAVTNVVTLGRNATSAYHSFRIENFKHVAVNNLRSLFATHGPVLKAGDDGHFSNIWSAGHASDCVDYKAGSTGELSTNLTNSTLSDVFCGYAQTGDSRGIELDGQNGTIQNVAIDKIVGNGVSRCLDVEADGGTITGIQASKFSCFAPADSSTTSNSYEGINVGGSGSWTNSSITDFTATGFDLGVNWQGGATTLSNIAINGVSLFDDWGKDIVGAGATAGQVTVNHPNIQHTPPTTVPVITASIDGGGALNGCTVTNPGAGLYYVPSTTLSAPTSGSGASITLTVNSSRQVSGCTFVAGTAVYASAPTVTVSSSWLSTTGAAEFYAQGLTTISVFDATANIAVLCTGANCILNMPARAGTPLPTCGASTLRLRAVVTDATSPTYMGAYTSGGAITAEVICSYNGTTYQWLTH